MITQKKSTLERILLSATDEFLEKGYEGAGLREIASKADVTTGAFYRHFKGKQELFAALVGDTYNGMIRMYVDTLSSFFEHTASEQVASMREITVATVDRMTEFMYQHRTETKLILEKSEGTEFSNLAGVLASMDKDATDRFADSSRNAGINVNDVHMELEMLLTESMFGTYLELMKKDLSIEEMKECSHTLIDFYEAGWWKIMGL